MLVVMYFKMAKTQEIPELVMLIELLCPIDQAMEVRNANQETIQSQHATETMFSSMM